MGFKHDKNPKRSSRHSYFKNLKENKKGLEHFFSLSRELREDKNNIESDTYIKNISKYLNEELKSEYVCILSLYKFQDHIELDRSDLNKTTSFNWDHPHEEIIELFSMVQIQASWKVNSSSIIPIHFHLNASSESKKYQIQYRKKESPVSIEFSNFIPTHLDLNLFWNEDYCLDIKSPYGEIQTIWLCTRDYT